MGWSLPWEKRSFPLSDEQVKELESEDPVIPVSVPENVDHPSNSCQPSSRTNSRSRSRSVEVRLVKLKSESQLYRSDSIEEEVEGHMRPDNEDNIKDEVADDDPEYEPQPRKE